MLENLDRVPTFVQQLQFTVKNTTVGKAATFTKVSSLEPFFSISIFAFYLKTFFQSGFFKSRWLGSTKYSFVKEEKVLYLWIYINCYFKKIILLYLYMIHRYAYLVYLNLQARAISNFT